METTVQTQNVETEEKFTMKIFVSDYRGYCPMDNEPDPIICRFTPFKVASPQGERDAGQYLCHDEKIFNRLIKHPDLGKGFKLVKRLPSRTNHAGFVISGVVTGGQTESKIYTDEERMLLRELGNLEAKFLKEDGSGLKQNVKKEAGDKALERIQYIKNKMNII